MSFAEALQPSWTADCPPSNPYCWDALAWELYKAGKYTEAERSIHEALRSGLSEPIFHYHAGLIAYALGKKREAVASVKHALVLNGGKSF